MQMFMTKTWGFSDPCGPLQFGDPGFRKSAMNKLSEGDLVAIVGTKGPETDESERGRILGIMEPSREPVPTLDFIRDARPEDFNGGTYKWPYALRNLRAWILEERPLLSDVSSRDFHMDAARGIVALTQEEARSILKLKRAEVALWGRSVHGAGHTSTDGAEQVRRISPPPATTRRGVMHMRRAEAYTYAFRIVGSPVFAFKVGWSFDWKRRQRQFNQASMPELGGLKYSIELFQRMETAFAAYRFEQGLLRHFSSTRHERNHEIITDINIDEFKSAWAQIYINILKQRG